MRGYAAENVLHSISNLDDIKDNAHLLGKNFDQQVIDKSSDQWRNKQKAVVQLNGGHSKQLFWLSGSFAVVLLRTGSVCIL